MGMLQYLCMGKAQPLCLLLCIYYFAIVALVLGMATFGSHLQDVLHVVHSVLVYLILQ